MKRIIVILISLVIVDVSASSIWDVFVLEMQKRTDSDNDLLSNYQELHVYNTNPNNEDTDGDTLNDYQELNVYNTNPNNEDTDGDGIHDDIEINLGNLEIVFDPLIASAAAQEIFKQVVIQIPSVLENENAEVYYLTNSKVDMSLAVKEKEMLSNTSVLTNFYITTVNMNTNDVFIRIHN